MARKRGSRSKSKGGAKSKSESGQGKKGSWLGRWFRRALIWGTVFGVLGAIALGTAVYFAAQSIPSYQSLMGSQNGQTIIVRARDGTEVISLGPSYGEWLAGDDIPQIMRSAMVSVEDRRYYSHFGIDILGLGRAVYESFRDSDRVSATSTITQQLARNIFLNSNRTLDRKAREAVLALALETKFSKAEILELYLNKVYFGGGAYGIDSASRKFFSHSAREMSVAEAAIIAGLVKAPSNYSPTADVDAAVGRGNVVLGQMLKYGAITNDQAEAIDVSAVKLKKDEGQNSIHYFTDWALPQLDMLLPNSNGSEPIEVWTTLDISMQRAATSAIASNVPDGTQGALVSLDRDGAVLALVGGTDYVSSNYNRATTALRQPGSSWKLFVYLAALEAGYTPDSSVKDVPVTIDGWSPRNSGGKYAGEIDVRTAFAYSKNTVAAQLGNEVGFHTVASMARRFGITTEIDTFPSMVLGSSEVRVIDMTRAFAAVSAGGESVEPFGILKVTNSAGEVLYEHKRARTYQLVPDYVAAGITDLLQTAVNTGTGRAAQIGRPVAGKTGTTSSNKDGWFVGFSSGITTGVWMGRDDAKAVPGLSGGSAPARAFAAYMRHAVRDRPSEEFDTELTLPEWQLEPDDEYYYGDAPGDYYFTDDQGNLIEPSAPDRPGEDFFPIEDGWRDEESDDAFGDAFGDAGSVNVQRGGDEQGVPIAPPAAPPAASDDFLQEAIGGELPRDTP